MGKKMKDGIICAVLVMVLFSAVWVAAAPGRHLWNFDGDQQGAIAKDFSGEVG